MRWFSTVWVVAALTGTHTAQAGSLTYSHATTSLPGAPGPAITLLSITGLNDGTNYTFTLTFANPTIEGPSSDRSDAVYGFINMDTDRKLTTGMTGALLDAESFEPGFGRYTPSFLGIDAAINLSSEGDPVHGAPGIVDVVPVTSNGFGIPIATESVTYTNQVGTTPSTMKIVIPLTVFSAHQIPLLDTGDFSVVVGNANNATDFLPTAAVPEPASLFLLSTGMTLGVMAVARPGRRGGRPR